MINQPQPPTPPQSSQGLSQPPGSQPLPPIASQQPSQGLSPQPPPGSQPLPGALQSSGALPPASRPLPPAPKPRKQRIPRTRRFLRSRLGRIFVPLIALLLGVVVGIAALLLYGLSGDGQLLVVPAQGTGNIIIQADKAYLTHLIQVDMQNSGMPGTIQNVNVTLANGDSITVNADDTFSVLGIGVTKHFTLVEQPAIAACQLQIHTVHADLNGIPVTGFVQAFESNANQQLQQKPSTMPGGFNYCVTSVRTDTANLFITYSATPLAMDMLSTPAW